MDSARASRMAAELTGQKIGVWQIENLIAYGKSALVLKATNGSRESALKVFDPELIERFGETVQLTRVNRELSLRGKNHPHLVEILDGGKCDSTGLIYVVMELIKSPNLADSLSLVPRDAIWPIISQIASAAQHLEEHGLAHRDIKPDNIAIAADFQKAILLDLGVIRPIGFSNITDDSHKSFVGTLQYSSPEFLFRKEEDTKEGWRALTFYQIGAVLHDLIMRKRIFSDFTDPFAQLVEAVKWSQPQVNAVDVPPDLISLAKNCLQKDPHLRLQLVTWESFTPAKTNRNTTLEAKERIQKRRLVLQNQNRAPHNSEEQESQNRRSRRALDEIQTSIEGLIRRETIGSGAFPPLEMYRAQTPDPATTDLLVCFGASQEHGLSRAMAIWFRTQLLDVPSLVASISFDAVSTTTPANLGVFKDRIPSSIYQGAFESGVLEPIIQNILYTIMDQAQSLDTDNAPEIAYLSLP